MAHLTVRTHLDGSFANEHGKLSYPYIYIPQFGEEIALMVTCIRPGILPLVLSDGSSLKQVGSCEFSALELSKLLRVYRFELVLSETDRRKMRDITDVMEVLAWMQSSSSQSP